MEDERNDLDPVDLNASRAEAEILRRLDRLDRKMSAWAGLFENVKAALDAAMDHPLIRRHLRR